MRRSKIAFLKATTSEGNFAPCFCKVKIRSSISLRVINPVFTTAATPSISRTLLSELTLLGLSTLLAPFLDVPVV